jgi:hypothetical protein
MLRTKKQTIKFTCVSNTVVSCSVLEHFNARVTWSLPKTDKVRAVVITCPRMSFLKECSVRSPHVLHSLYQPAPATRSSVTHIYSVSFSSRAHHELLRLIACLLVLIRFPCSRHPRCKHSVVFLYLFTFISGYIGYIHQNNVRGSVSHPQRGRTQSNSVFNVSLRFCIPS